MTSVPRVLALCLIVLSGCASRSHTYTHAAVACDHPVASRAGLEMLERGGNAVDAAVAASFCLSVVRPDSCGIGGGGFMVVHTPGRDPVAINYRETSPAAVGRDYYVRLDDPLASRFGAHAIGVPGTVAGLLRALQQHGTLDHATVLEPAIRAARDGFAADAHHVSMAATLSERRDEMPHLRNASEYLWRQLCLEGEIEVGDRLTNPEQMRALELIAAGGASAFYRGPIADAICDAVAAGGGGLNRDDLAGYTVSESAPLVGTFAGRTILSMPPPSSGGVAMQQILGMLDRRVDDLRGLAPNSPAYVHLLSEAMKHAFADRAEWLADATFVDVPVSRLVSDAYLDERAAEIDLARTRTRYDYGSVVPGPEDAGTSHISVVDASGMAVACTETINLSFGSLVCVPGYGFALNDEMDDFTTIPGQPNAFGLRQSDRNLPEPGKRPLSSMSPTIVLRDGEVEIVAGASGGPRIITGTLQAILNCLEHDGTASEAVASPRFHHQWMPERVDFDEAWTDDETIRAMAAYGHETGRRESIGNVQLIRMTGNGIQAASDPRKGGEPAGY